VLTSVVVVVAEEEVAVVVVVVAEEEVAVVAGVVFAVVGADSEGAALQGGGNFGLVCSYSLLYTIVG
jgi:hypothetical protein